MAFITAATRSDIVELAMGMLNKAPSTTMLNTLVEKSSAGSTIQDLADYIATTDEFTAEYPSTQTAREFATEMFAKLITGGTLDAAINTAVIDLLEGMLTAGTTKAEGFVAVIDYLSNTANNTNADLGDISKSFQNRADAAEYFSITKELGGSTDAELAAAIATVTSDAATLTAANTAADATAAVVVVTPGTTYTLTTGTDFVSGTALDDIINAVRGGSASTTETYSPTDQINGGGGTDTLYIESDRTAENLATVTNMEKIQVTNAGAAASVLTVTLPNDKAYTNLENLNSTGEVTFSAISNADMNGGITSQPNGEVTTFGYTSTALLGATDNLDVELVGVDGDLTLTGGTTANAMETITLNSLSDGEIDTLTTTNMNTTKLVFTGSGALNVKAITDTGATINVYDASASTGNITVTGDNTASNTITGGAGNDSLGGAAGNDVITGGTGNDQITGGAGNDNLDGGAGDDTIVLSNVTVDDTVAGGEGTDVLSLAAEVGYTAILNSGVGISGFETIKTTGAVTQDFLGLAGNAITKAVTGSNSAVTLRETAITAVDASTSGANGTLSISQATDGAADAMAVTLGSVLGVSSAQLTLNSVDSESVTVNSVGATGNSLTLGNNTAGKTATATAAAVAAAAATATDLTSITITGSEDLTVIASSKNTALATVNADAFTGDTLTVTANSGTTQAAMTVTAPTGTSATINTGKGADKVTVGDGGTALTNTITTGDGADTIVSGAGADSIDSGDDGGSITSGAGNDTIDSGDGADTITLGDGDDTVNTSGAGADVIDGGAGNDTVTTAGAGADSITGGTGNDTLSGGADNDTVLGGEGNDTLNGDAGNDSIAGGAGNDIITDGAGNDTVTGGDGNDTITISTGNDNVSGGAGNDTLSITGLSAADTLDGGAGTDSLTVTNSSGATLAPTFTSIESLTVNTSSNFVLTLTNATDTTSLKSYTITSNGTATADNVTLTDIASGSTVNLSDDSSWDGTAGATANDGDLGVIAIDTVAGAVLTLNVSANEDALTHTGTVFTTSTTIGDASTVTINSKNSDSNDIVNDLVSLVLDATETQSLALVAEDSAGLDTGVVTGTTALQSLTLSSAAGAASVIGTVADATGLQTLSITSTGAGSSASIGDIAAASTTEGQLTSLTVSAGGTSTTTLQDIFSDQSSAVTSISIKANDANSTVDLTADTALDFGTATVGALTIGVADNATLLFDAQSIVSGLITTASLTVGDYATVNDSGSAGEDLTITGASTTFNVSLGRGIINAGGDDIVVSGGITSLALTTSLDDEAIALNSSHTLSYDGAVFGDFGTIAKASYQHTGTGALTWDGTNIGSSAILGNTVTSTQTSSTSDALTGGAGTDTLTGNIGANTLIGNAGDDTLKGNLGADTLTGSAGNDVINLTETTQSADTVVINSAVGGTADSAVVVGSSSTDADDTGGDTISGFDSGSDVIQVVATAVVGYNHTTALSVGTGVAGVVGTATAVDAFVKNTLMIGLNPAAAVNDAGDIVVKFSDFALNGVSQLGAADFLTVADVDQSIQYNITGTTAANTIVAGDLADTIAGGNAADVLTGGTGADTFVFAQVGSGVAVIDTILDFVGGTDIIDLPVAATGTINIGSTGANVSIATTLGSSTGTSEANLLTDLNIAAAARQSASAGLYAQTGDTFQVTITGNSLLGTNATYVVQEVGGVATTVTTDDIIIGLVGTSSGNISVATII